MLIRITNKKIENSLWGVNKNDPPNLIKLTIVIMQIKVHNVFMKLQGSTKLWKSNEKKGITTNGRQCKG